MKKNWVGRPVGGLLAAVALCLASGGASAADFLVNTVNDSGPASLRQAILDANALPGPDRILFNIAGSGVHTIALTAPLPSLLESVEVDGSTQPGYSEMPLIELTGAAMPAGTSGLRILASNCTVRGLVINRFPGNGIHIEGGGTNVMRGNFIGTDATGASAAGNGAEGIMVLFSFGNWIGGDSPGLGNLISGNGDAGAYIYGGGGNIIQGNRVGTDQSGLLSLGNTNNGIAVFGSPGNYIGSGTPGARNLISGNRGSGIYLINGSTASNFISGNFIGTTLSGAGALSNSADGITIEGAGWNLVGGTFPGAGNVLSGNGKAGISIIGPGATNNQVLGNYIGTDALGVAGVPNNSVGVWLQSASGNQIGGADPGGRNLISGNRQDGVYILTNSSANVVSGNSIGVDAAGAKRLPNGFNGISLNAATNNTIGGFSPGEGNVISGNAGHGIQLGPTAGGNRIQRNYIGTAISGMHAASNGLAGIRIESASNQVGGSGAGNIISGNGLDGIYLYSSSASNNLILGNLIGTIPAGTAALGNGRAGIVLSGAGFNTIGSAGPGEANVISANRNAGIYMDLAGTRGNQIMGNRIGTDLGGTAKLGNSFEGIYGEAVGTNYFGSSLPGGGNIVAGNYRRGLYFLQSSGNQFQGNLMGTAADGIAALPNAEHNLEFDTGCNNNVVGGSVEAGNRFAYAPAPYAGVRIRTGSVHNELRGNLFFGNGGLGIDLGNYYVDTNDSCDADDGANGLQNFPVITNAVTGAGTQIWGKLNSKASASYDLQFYANPACNSSGNGEGMIFLGQTSVVTGGACLASFVAYLPVSLPPGYVATAIAINGANGNTSEFGECFPVITIPSPQITLAAGLAKISWPNTTGTYKLKQTGSLVAPVQWVSVTNQPVLQAGRWVVTLPLTPHSSFYALSY